jgi:hypothetical protein
MEMKEFIKAALETTKSDIDKMVSRLTPELLRWQPQPGTDFMGLLLYGGIRDEDSLIHMAKGEPPLWDSEQWYQRLHQVINDGGGEHYTAEQMTAFVMPDLKELLAYGEAVRKDTLEYLNGLKPEDFDKKVPPPAKYATVGLTFVRLITHSGSHRGKMGNIRDLLPTPAHH